MRAFAVLAVFAGHLFNWPPGGFVGVDVFFVLSGFFITGLLIRERTRSGAMSFKNFYVRRVRRIIPSAILVLIVTVAASYLLLTATRAKDALIDALWAAIFLSNWRFGRVGTDYFAIDQAPSPLLHYWSLSIEEQFYFVWPVLLLGLFALTRRYSSRRDRYTPTRQAWLATGMGTICLASFGLACYQLASNAAAAYFSTFTRIWELGIGALLAITAPLLGRMPNRIRPLLSYVGLAGAVASLFLITDATPFPGPWALLPTLSTAIVIAAFVDAPVRGVPHLTNRVSDWFGDTSYTLYLWHWPVLVLLEAVLPKTLTYYIAVIIIALTLTALTYRYYENPIRKSQWLDPASTRKPTPAVWALIGASAAGAIVVALVNIQVEDHRAGEQTVIEALPVPVFTTVQNAPPGSKIAPLTVPLPGKDPCFGAPAILDPQCGSSSPDAALTPSIDDFAIDAGAPICWTERDADLNSCTYGYRGADARRLALVGDSHSSRVLVALAPYLEAMKWRLTTYVGWGCTWQDPPADTCTRGMAETQKQLLDERYDLVLTTASREWGTRDGYIRAWAPVAEGGTKIAVLTDNPAVNEESLACLTRVTMVNNRTEECGIPRAEALAKDDPLIAAAAHVPDATVIDLTQYYCTDKRCPVVIGGVIVYADTGSHLTATYISTLAPAIVDGVRQALN